MARNLRSVILYQGLFLMVLGLYGSSRLSSPPKVEARHSFAKVEERLRGLPVFQGGLDGFRLAAGENGLKVEIQSEELYSGIGERVEAVWMPTIDPIAAILIDELTSGRELILRVSGSELGLKRSAWIQAHLTEQFGDSAQTHVRIEERAPALRGVILEWELRRISL